MAEPLAYLRDGAAIYERSFAIIRAEADLSAFSPDEAEIVVRMVHACGLVEAAARIAFGGDLVTVARRALSAGAAILCDAEMVAHGVTRARLPAHNDVICMLRGERRHARIAQRADHLVSRRKPRARDAVGDHLGIAQDRRPALKRAPRRADKPGREADVPRRIDEPTGMDHAHGDLGLLRRKAAKVGLGADDGEGALVDRSAVAQIGGLSHGRPRLRRARVRPRR